MWTAAEPPVLVTDPISPSGCFFFLVFFYISNGPTIQTHPAILCDLCRHVWLIKVWPGRAGTDFTLIFQCCWPLYYYYSLLSNKWDQLCHNSGKSFSNPPLPAPAFIHLSTVWVRRWQSKWVHSHPAKNSAWFMADSYHTVPAADSDYCDWDGIVHQIIMDPPLNK